MDNNAVLLLVLQFCRAQPGGSQSAGGGWSCQLSPQKCICLLGQMLRCKVLQPGDRCPALSGCRLSRPKRLPAHPETWTEADVRRQSTQVAARYQVTSDRPIRCLETLGRPMGGPGLRAERPDVKPGAGEAGPSHLWCRSSGPGAVGAHPDFSDVWNVSPARWSIVKQACSMFRNP